MNAPDLTKKALGYRQFAVRDGGLCSLGVGTLHWLPGPNHARCAARLVHARNAMMYSGSGMAFGPYERAPLPSRHAAPASGCACGLYGLHDFSEEWHDGHMATTEHGLVIVGAILGWGRLEVHRNGYRAEWAEVALLGYDPWIGVRRIGEVQDVARLYGVRAVDLERFAEEAPTMGERVPENLLPPKPKPPAETAAYQAQLSAYQKQLAAASSSFALSFGTPGRVDQGADTEEEPAPTRRVRSRLTHVLVGSNLVFGTANGALVAAGGGGPFNAAVFLVNLLIAALIWFGIPTYREVPA